MALTIPNTFSTGVASSAAAVNANFQAVVDWSNGNIDTASLSAPYCTMSIAFCVPGAVGTQTYRWRITVPTSTTWVPLVFDYSAQTIAAGTTITFTLTGDATNSFTSPLVLTDTDDATAKSSTAFGGLSTYVAGTVLTLTAVVAVSTATDLSAYLTVKTLIRS